MTRSNRGRSSAAGGLICCGEAKQQLAIFPDRCDEIPLRELWSQDHAAGLFVLLLAGGQQCTCGLPVNRQRSRRQVGIRWSLAFLGLIILTGTCFFPIRL